MSLLVSILVAFSLSFVGTALTTHSTYAAIRERVR